MQFLKKLTLSPLNFPTSRRARLIEAMASLEGQKIDCMNCSGTCCTYVANSMQITPLEALEILDSLNVDKREREELVARLSQTVKDFRLDQELLTGKKGIQSFRRTYTCPFFTPGPKGCALSRSAKPYGCLAFNPRIAGDNGSKCTSDIDLLEKREADFKSFEDSANEKIAAHFSLNWKKMDLPRALIYFLTHPEFNEHE